MDKTLKNATHILVIDDDRRIRELLDRYLTKHDMIVNTACDAVEAREMLTYFDYDLIVCDVMMPGENGFDLTRTLRKSGVQIPILLLTAMGESKNRIEGLETGADDYLVKPFEPRELLLRIQSILRRQPDRDKSVTIRFGHLNFDTHRNILSKDNDVIPLTSVENQLLKILIDQSHETVSRFDLLKKAGIDGNERTVDVQVTRLRRKIEPEPKRPRYLQTVRGEGYVLHPDAEEE